MAHKQKTGRTADSSQRNDALRLLELHGLAEQSPDGSYCVNPEADPGQHTYVYADTLLVDAIKHFAKHGTLKISSTLVRPQIVRAQLKRHCDARKSYADAIYLLS